MDSAIISNVKNLVHSFAESDTSILAAAICGSVARGTAGVDSDIDLSILTSDIKLFKSTEWHEKLDLKSLEDEIDSYRDEIYGPTWSRHMFFKSDLEIEFGFCDPNWASTSPIDQGTHNVVSDGFQIIYDPEKIYRNLVEAVDKTKQ